MNAVKKTTRKRRAKLNRYRVWFKDGTDVVVEAQYPKDVPALFPVDVRMKISSIVDAI